MEISLFFSSSFWVTVTWAIKLLTELGMPWLVVGGVICDSSCRSSWTVLCVFEVGGGRGGNGGGERLCMDRDFREGTGGGISQEPLLEGKSRTAKWLGEDEVFVTEQSCKTQQKLVKQC